MTSLVNFENTCVDQKKLKKWYRVYHITLTAAYRKLSGWPVHAILAPVHVKYFSLGTFPRDFASFVCQQDHPN